MATNRKKDVSFSNSLYKGKTVPELIRLYQSDLRSTGIPANYAHATILENYLSYYKNTAPIELADGKIEDSPIVAFCKLVDCFLQSIPGFSFKLTARVKSTVSTEMKIRKKKESGILSNIEDFYGVRIVDLDEGMTMINIYRQYAVFSALLDFLQTKDHTICEKTEDKIKETENVPNDILIPSKDDPIIKTFKYTNFIDDYIVYTNKNGYQCLHATVLLPDGKHRVEIQIRLWGMHMRAEYGEASHFIYKELYHKEFGIEFDRKKVQLNGYKCFDIVIPNEDPKAKPKIETIIHDDIGFDNSLNIYSSGKYI